MPPPFVPPPPDPYLPPDLRGTLPQDTPDGKSPYDPADRRIYEWFYDWHSPILCAICAPLDGTRSEGTRMRPHPRCKCAQLVVGSTEHARASVARELTWQTKPRPVLGGPPLRDTGAHDPRERRP